MLFGASGATASVTTAGVGSSRPKAHDARCTDVLLHPPSAALPTCKRHVDMQVTIRPLIAPTDSAYSSRTYTYCGRVCCCWWRVSVPTCESYELNVTGDQKPSRSRWQALPLAHWWCPRYCLGLASPFLECLASKELDRCACRYALSACVATTATCCSSCLFHPPLAQVAAS